MLYTSSQKKSTIYIVIIFIDNIDFFPKKYLKHYLKSVNQRNNMIFFV